MSSQLPDVLNVKPLNFSESMSIDTNILDPIIVNNNFTRFVLERKGILDVGSVFTFSVHPVSAGDGKCFLPVKTGIHALIKKAVLKVGAKTLATSDEYGTYQTIKRAFKTNEEKEQKDLVKVGSSDVMQPDNQGTGKYQMKSAVYSAIDTALDDPSVRLRTSTTECPVFQVRLSELFPMMRSVQLPLQFINDDVSIEITFNTQSSTQEGIIALFESGYSGDKSISVGTQNVKFLANYLNYSDDRMGGVASQVLSAQGLVMPYEDIILTSTSIPALTSAPTGTDVVKQDVIRDIGVSGKNVRSILVHNHASSNALMGKYSSDAFNVPEEYNFRINDKRVYSRNVVNEARKSNQLKDVFSTNINCLAAEYSNDPLTNKQVGNQPVNNNIISANTFHGHSQSDLQGRMHFTGVDLSTSPLQQIGAGTQVGQKPVEHILQLNRTAQNNAARSLKYYSMVERLMTIKGGQVLVSS